LIRGDLSVRSLAEFVCRQGDLYEARAGRQVEPEEGIAKQQAVQHQLAELHTNYQREVPVEAEFSCANGERQVKGRMDGLWFDDDVPVVEEYKCCGELPEVADSVDLGQAWCYAGMYAWSQPEIPDIEVRLVYLHADSEAQRCFSERVSTARARHVFALLLQCYVVRIDAHYARVRQRQAWATQLEFPMPSYRTAQQAIARRVYGAIRNGENLLLEAPTGSGKTLAVLFPALKAQELEDQVFFLTSRNAGAMAAMAAVSQIDPRQEQLSVVELTAKEKVCFVPGMPCDPQVCEFAAGYFDRAAPAVADLVAQKLADRPAIESTARSHRVCPFELSLDVTLWADVIVGDYNYVFDPVVRLKRFAGHDQLHLLVDEAHQLSPRARSMLSVSIRRAHVSRAKRTTHPLIAKRVASIDRALLKLRRTHGQGEHLVDDVASIERASERLLETVAAEDIALEQYPEITDLYFDVFRWARSASWYAADVFTHIVQIEDRDVSLTRACLDPGTYLQSIYSEHGAVVRFSGTLTPLSLYQRLHGATNDMVERAQSPFGHDQALVMIVPDVPTYYRQREASMPKLAALIASLVSAQPGRYIVALPSYAYLQALSACSSDPWGAVFSQSPGQDQEQSKALLEEFSATEEAVLLIVMGGIYGESVDFTHAKLRGVVMVGLGLPPPSLERNAMQSHFDATEGDGWGRMVAYTQPALVKNIQAAGRLIRSASDVGVICMVDQRFNSAEVRQFFPSHWVPQVTRSADVRRLVTQFWRTTQA